MRTYVFSVALLFVAACKNAPLPQPCSAAICDDGGGTPPDDASSGDDGATPDGAGPADASEMPCADGAVEVRACGNCGTMKWQCSGGIWQASSPCNGERECSPGAMESTSCGSSVGACVPGTQSRTCWADCTWSGWSSCGGAYVGPTTEVCGDGVDNNCSGVADEGCSCAPVAVGQGDSLALSGPILKMMSDPNPLACLVYALGTAMAAPELIVIDTRNKSTLATIPLPDVPSDFDISPNGQYLVVGYMTPKKISVIDKSQWSVATTLASATYVSALEVDDSGLVYYHNGPLWDQIHSLDLLVGSASDKPIGTPRTWSTDQIWNSRPMATTCIRARPGQAAARQPDTHSRPEQRSRSIPAAGMTGMDFPTRRRR